MIKKLLKSVEFLKDEIAEMKKSHTKEVDEMKQLHAEEVGELKAQIDEMKQLHAEEVGELNKEVKKLNTKYAALKSENSSINQEISNLVAQVLEIADTYKAYKS